MLIGLIVSISIILQFLTIVFALRLIQKTGFRLSWSLISLAIFLMGVRRMIALFSVINGADAGQSPLIYEIIGLATSALMLAGVVLIHPVFRSIKENEDKLKILSITDELTGLYNRRGLTAFAEHYIQIANRTKKGFYLLYADLDGMKRINDTWGHQDGDRALLAAAAILKKTFRNSDIVARVGGDEFVVMPVGFAGDAVDLLSDRLQKNIDAYNSGGKLKHQLSLSSGISFYDPLVDCSLNELLNKSDEAMYRMKERHRKTVA